MSTSTPVAATPRTGTGAGYGPASRTTDERTAWRETKPSTKTTELWLTVVGVVLLAVIYNVSRDASLNLFRACTLAMVLGAAYIVSRGLAKAGSHDDCTRSSDIR